MFLEKSQITTHHTKNTYINNLDILQIASLIEYNLAYAMAFLISQDNSLVKTIITTHNKIEDKTNILLEILEEDVLAQDDTLHRSLLTNFTSINTDTIGIIKITVQLHRTCSEATEVLQDANKIMSLMFKSTIDAYVQKDGGIAEKSLLLKNQLDEFLQKITHIMGSTISHQIQKIVASITNLQCDIIELYKEA